MARTALEQLANTMAQELMIDPRLEVFLNISTQDLNDKNFEEDEIVEELYYARRLNIMHKLIALIASELAINY